MQKRVLAIVLAISVLLLAISAASAQSVATNDDEHPKAVPSAQQTSLNACWFPPCVYKGGTIWWARPTKEPDSYRVQWTTDKWPKNKKASTKTKGNVFTTDQHYDLSRKVEVPYGTVLRVRIRARYDGKKNGPWFCCLELGNGIGETESTGIAGWD